MSEFTLPELLNAGVRGLGPALVEKLPAPWRLRTNAGKDYDLTDPPLVAAIQAAMLLGQPLILAGEPGVGKTTLAEALADRLGLHYHDPVQVKSVTTGLDLFCGFDEIGRFRDASRRDQSNGAPVKGLRDYVRFSSLGRAILWSAGPDAQIVTGSVGAAEIMGGEQESVTLRLGDIFPREFWRTSRDEWGTITMHAVDCPTRSIALLDELDKAPRDSPNDVLGELDSMSFRIRELDIEIVADPTAWPILLITSNSERSLPDAFLRRCVFHWIDFPLEERLFAIVAGRCSAAYGIKASDPLVVSAVELFLKLRTDVENKKPATAELISFLVALIEFGFPADRAIDPDDPSVVNLFGTMMKTFVDLEAAAARPSAKHQR